MKAITIWQPWASLLVSGRKRYETRSWATSYRGPIAIHAAKRPVRQTIDALVADRGDGWLTLDYFESLFMRPGEMDQLPTGAIVGTAILTRCNLITEAFVAKLTPMELALGDFTLGRYAWEFHGKVPADPPIPAKGMQGLWELNPKVGIVLFACLLTSSLETKRIPSRICDGCGKTIYAEDMDIDSAMRKAGWARRKNGSEWEDYCPDCQRGEGHV